MERRSEPRFDTDQPALVTLLVEPEEKIPGHLSNVSGKGMCLRTGVPVAVGLPVRIDVNDRLYLGETCYCRESAEGGHIVGVQLEHALYDLCGLAALAEQLEDPSSPAPAPRR